MIDNFYFLGNNYLTTPNYLNQTNVRRKNNINDSKENVLSKIDINEFEMGNDLKNENDVSLQENSIEKLKRIEEQREADYFLKKKKQIWLQAEKIKKKREEKEKKIKSSLQAKQKAQEEMRKKLEKKSKRKQMLEERKKQKRKREKEETTKVQIFEEKKLLEERARKRCEEEKHLRLEALKLEAKKIIEEEKAWKNKINEEYALKMGDLMDSKNLAFKIIPTIDDNKDESSLSKSIRNRFIQHVNNTFSEMKRKDQVFDPGNLTKQLIKKELKKTENKQVKIKLKIKLILFSHL